MNKNVGIINIVNQQNETISTYIGSIISCNGMVLNIKGMDLVPILKQNGESLTHEQLKTLAGADKLYENVSLDIDGKSFAFLCQWKSKMDTKDNSSN